MVPGKFARWVIVAGVTALLALPAVASASPPEFPPGFFGIGTQQQRPQSEYNRMKLGGLDSNRFGLPWNAIERSPGNYDFSSVDPVVEQTVKAGLEAFPFAAATPSFYGSGDIRDMPSTDATRQAFAAFLKASVRRYGPGGSFWSEHGPGSPDPVPYRPIRTWQIWNEANFFYFTQPISPDLFGRLIVVAHDAIHSVDPGAQIVLSGLFGHPKAGQGLAATEFLDQAYAVPGFANSFDGVALHPYATNPKFLTDDINELRQVLENHDDANKGLYITEMGWGDGTDTGFELGPQGQLNAITTAYTILGKMWREAHIRQVFWFAWDDIHGTCNFCDSVGLFTEAGQPKPAWFRFLTFSGCFGREATILGTDGPDKLVGTPGPDVIFGEGGNDVISGLGGNDRICGGVGNDVINAGAGNDQAIGEQGADKIYLQGGRDQGFGGSGADLVNGGTGADILYGSLGLDRLLGGAGNDRLYGEESKDTLLGNAGNDLLVGGPGRNVIQQGPGHSPGRH